MSRKFKIFLYSALLLLVGCIATFPKQIMLQCVAWTTKSYCLNAFGARFEFEDLAWNDGKIIFKNGRLHKAGELSATFANASLLPFVNLRERTFGGKLYIDALRIVHCKKELRPVPSPPSPFFKLFHLQLDTIVEDGELLLYDYLAKYHFFQHARFDLNHHVSGKKTCGTIAFELAPNTPQFSTCFCNQEGEQWELSVHFQNHCLPMLAHLTTYFFQNYLPEPAFQWDILKGVVDGDLEIVLVKGAPLKISGEIELSTIKGENPSLNLLGEVDHVSCAVDIDFSNVSAINGAFDLQGGRIILQNSGVWQGMCDLKDVHANLQIQEGKVAASNLKGYLMGMQAELTLDWQAQDVIMEIGFAGESHQMQGLIPPQMQKRFFAAFPDDHFALQAQLKRSHEGLELAGKLLISDQIDNYELLFDCLLSKSETVLTEKELPIPHDLGFSLSRSVDEFLEQLKHQFCLAHKRFGWFEGKAFPLEKFLSPFLLHDVNMDMKGLVDFKGTFDDRYAVIFYEGKDFDLHSPHFQFHVDSVTEHLSSEITAVHYVDLKNWSHVGFLPLKNADYWQKNYDFHLSNASAIVNFENNIIRIQNIETSADELNFNGNVLVEIHSLNDVDLKISADHIQGPIKDAQTFLAHFKPSFFWNIPAEGIVWGEKQALFFHYHFSPTATLVQGLMQGKVHVNAAHPLLQLQDYEATISYEGISNTLEIQNGAGKLLLPDRLTCLEIFTPSLKLTNLPDFLVDFSCALTNGAHPFLMLNGTSQRTELGKEMCITGEGIAPYEKIQVKLLQNGNNLKVESACGLWSTHADLTCNPHEILIHELSCMSENTALVSLSGQYSFAEQVLKGNIEEIMWDLQAPFKKSISRWKPHGTVTGSGTFVWNTQEGIKAHALMSFHELECGGIYFGSGHHIRCDYSSCAGLSVEGLQAEIPIGSGIEKYKLGRLHYASQEQKILFDEFDFSLPPEKLPWVTEMACTLFPGKIYPVAGWMEAFKCNGTLDGQISLQVDPEHIWVYLRLKDGTYFLSDKQFDLKNFQLEYSPDELHLSTQVLYRDAYYWLHLKTDSNTMSQGTLALSENACSEQAIIAVWTKDDNDFSIKTIKGTFCGIDVNLKEAVLEKNATQLALQGSIEFESAQIARLLKPSWKQIIDKINLLGSYALEGTFLFDPESAYIPSFVGQVIGQNCQAAGICMASLSTNLNYMHNKIEISDFTIQDWAGNLSIQNAALTKSSQEQWYIDLDHLCLNALRLSRLKSPWTCWHPGEKPFYRSLFIPSFILDHLSGNLKNLCTLLGSGKIEFTNLPKKTFFTNLLFLPTEITARIGLDLTTLIPVRGTIEYDIHNGRVNFTELKEVYSDGKRSRFYLAEGTEAFIDFNGNLNLQVKMKQYSLLMKLAEFFTVSIKGTLLHPTYTFSNHVDIP